MSKNLEKSEFQTLNPRIPIIHTLNDEIVKIEYCAEMKELSLKSQVSTDFTFYHICTKCYLSR